MIPLEAKDTIINLHKSGLSIQQIVNAIGYRKQKGATKKAILAEVEETLADLYKR